MKRTFVSSTNITAIGYDADKQILEVEFRNGGVYQYFYIPEIMHQGIMHSEAVGAYLAENIKGRYRYSMAGSMAGSGRLIRHLEVAWSTILEN